MDRIDRPDRTRALFPLLVLAVGLFARLWQFGGAPAGLNQDEAFAGYEAWSLLTAGTDTAGYAFPVYLTAWGSGMNALETYLMIPFIALFGLKVWVVRLPQLLVGLLSLWVMVPAARRMLGERAGLLAAFLLAVCPWHVMLSRWGLESNLAPGFLLFGLYFFLRGLEDSRFLMLSALMYGLSLYAYATIWPFVPLILLLELVYAFFCKKLRFDRNLLFSGLILALLALPLLLFLAVNFDLMGEIRTPFFSIPRLAYMRASEISLRHIPENLKTLAKILIRQTDGQPWNSPGIYGLLYPVSLPFAVLGGFLALGRVWKGGRRFCPEAMALINLLGAVLLGLLIDVNVNRVNIIFIPLVLLTALGLEWCCGRLGRFALPGALAVYAAFFLAFQVYYYTDYQEEIGACFNAGAREAVQLASEWEGPVYLSRELYYPQVLFFTQMPVEEFRAQVEYAGYPAAFLQVETFGRYRYYDGQPVPEPGASYILDAWTDPTSLEEAGFRLEPCGVFTVAVRELS